MRSNISSRDRQFLSKIVENTILFKTLWQENISHTE